MLKWNSETFLQDFHDVAGLAHGIEMDGRHAMLQKVLALPYAPLRACTVCRLPVCSCFPEGFRQFQGDVDREGLREKGDLPGCGNRFESGNDRNGDACLPAAVPEVVEHLVVEEHLRDY